MNQPSKLTNGTGITILAMVSIALFLLIAAVATIYIRPQTDPALLFPLVLGLIFTISARLQSHLTQMETLAQAKEGRLQAEAAVAKVEEIKETVSEVKSSVVEVKDSVVTLTDGIDGKIASYIDAVKELNVAKLETVQATLDERTASSEAARKLAAENTQLRVDAALQTPVHPPDEIVEAVSGMDANTAALRENTDATNALGTNTQAIDKNTASTDANTLAREKE